MSLSALSRISKTIGFRISLWYMGLLILAGVSLLILINLLLSYFLANRDRNSARTELQRLATVYSTGGIAAIRREMDTQEDKTNFFIRVLDDHGAEILSSDAADFDSFDLRRLSGMKPGSDGWMKLREKEQDPLDYVFAADTLEITTLVVPDHWELQVGKSSERRNDLKNALLWIFGILTIPVLLAVATFLSHRTLHPLRAMIATVQSIQLGKMSSRVPTSGSGDELDELARLFNAMLERIENLIKAMQDSLDNVAHDLRTPVTRLRATAETALQSNGPNETYREALEDCMEETEEILSMLETLMDISEAQTGAMHLQRENVSVARLIEDTVDLYRYVAEDRGLEILGSCPDDLVVHVDVRRIRQALANLVDNAVKFTEPGGRIWVEGGRSDHETTISIRDTGSGIAPMELPKIWERLYRSDDARSKKGIGLGLSLVRAIIQSHGGAVDAASNPGKGSVFTIHLPIEKENVS